MSSHAKQVESAGQVLKKARVERLSTQEFGADLAGGVADLLQWPEQIADIESIWVARTGLQSQLRENLNRRIWLTSAYSGMCTFEHVLARLAESVLPQSDWQRLNSGPEPQASRCGPIVHWSGFETSPACRELILSSEKFRPMHLFGDICDQCEPCVVAKMKFVVSTLRQRAKTMREEATETLAEKRRLAAGIEHLSARCMSKLIQIAKAACREGQMRETGYCWACKKECPYLPPRAPADVHCELGGNTCVAFSPQGNREKWLHDSAVPAALWLARAEHSGVDWMLQECSHCFNSLECFETVFKPCAGWQTSCVQLCPTSVGVPMRRPRNITWTINTGMFSLLQAFTADSFGAVAGSMTETSGHDFFCAPEKDVLCALEAQARAYSVTLAAGEADAGFKVLPEGARARLLMYEEEMRKQNWGSESLLPVLDLSQNVSVRKTMSATVPSILRGSRIWSCQLRREMLLRELFLAFGWPVPEMSSAGHQFPFPDEVLQKLGDRAMKAMLGNSVHCRLFGLVFAYVLMTTKMHAAGPTPTTVDDNKET